MFTAPLLASVAAATLAITGYVEATREAGVVVLRRADTSEIDLVAEGEIAAPPERIRALLLDYDAHSRFIRNLAESRVLSRGPADLVVYQRLALPVIADRDVTLHVLWSDEGKTLWMKYDTNVQGGPAPRPGVVRVPVEEGAWSLVPIDGGRATRVRFSLRLDLAGAVPRFIARSRAAAELPAMFESVRAQLHVR